MPKWIPAVALLALATTSAAADDAAAIVDKAVRATATSDLRLNRLGTIVRIERGVFYMPSGPMPTQRTVFMNPPDRLKYDAKLTTAGQQQSLVLTLNGVNGWKKDGPAITDFTPSEYDVMQDEAYAWWITTLLPLRQKGVKLKSAPSLSVDGRPAVGVSVPRPNRSDTQVYFDAQSGLPVRVRIKVREGPVEVGRDYDLAGHKDFDGIKLPTRISVTQNGRKTEEWTVEGYRTPDRLDEKEFAKPK